jgi:D-alanyl-D-alanine carboxypeptidase
VSSDPRSITRRRAVLTLAGGAATLFALRPLRNLWSSMTPDAVTGNAEAVMQELQRLLDGLGARDDVYSAVVAVESDTGSFRWIGTVGHADSGGTPMRADTPFHIASIDKLFTAAVVMRLHERGRLGLDDPIATHLPASLIGGLHRLGGVDHTESITVRHLLGHTSGLADCFEDRPKGGRSLMERLFAEGDMAWSIDDLTRLVRDELTPHFPPQPLQAQRQKVRYSDTNYQLLIALSETVTGEPLHRAYEELIFRPLDLRHTWLAGFSAPLDATSAPATLWFEDRPLALPLAIRSFPSVYSTAGDTLKFIRGLTGGELFEDPGTFERMQQPWNRFGLPFDAAALRAPSWPIEYGLGLMRFQLPRFLTPLHPMPAVIGHTGSTGSWLFHCPELDVRIAGTVNQATAGAVPYRFVPGLLRSLDLRVG